MLEARHKAKKLTGVSHNVPLTAVGMVLVFAGKSVRRFFSLFLIFL